MSPLSLAQKINSVVYGLTRVCEPFFPLAALFLLVMAGFEAVTGFKNGIAFLIFIVLSVWAFVEAYLVWRRKNRKE